MAFYGHFTLRGITWKETLTLTVPTDRKGVGTVKGTMAFYRKQYGMNSGIPFIKIANRVEVTVDLAGKRISGSLAEGSLTLRESRYPRSPCGTHLMYDFPLIET